MSIITLTTDFGTGSTYAAAMKGVILGINPAATLVDITHDVSPQDVRRGAVVLDDVTQRFPKDTIHVAVIDPGVGTDREILYARVGSQQYVAPDNGLLSRLTQRIEPACVLRLTNRKYWLEPISNTFHGRDIMAPVAAHLSLGLDPSELGDSFQALGGIDWPQVEVSAQRIAGTVIEVDSFGNLITNISSDLLAGRPTDNRVCVISSIYETNGVYSTYADHPRDTFIALVGSHGRIELAIVGDSAAARLGIQTGTPVVLSWE